MVGARGSVVLGPVKAWVYIDGSVVPADKAFVPVFDRGFLYGDSVYEVLRTYEGVPVWLSDHLWRLQASGERLGFESFPRPSVLEDAIRRTLATASVGAEGTDWYIRIVVTRGSGPISLDPGVADEPRVVVLVKEVTLPPAEAYDQGIALALVDVVRNPAGALDPAVKSGNYLNNILALRQALSQGADEAIMCNTDGNISEGASSNVFIVDGGTLRTPPIEAGILHGITRSKILEIAAELGVPIRDTDLTPADVLQADEVFISSSIREILPVAKVGDTPIGVVAPGPTTRRLHKAYKEAVLGELKSVTAPLP